MMALLLNANDSVSRSYSITKPSPLHPIVPSECGERTANLFDEQYPDIVPSTITYKPLQVGSGFFTLSTTTPIYSTSALLFFLPGIATSGASLSNNVYDGVSRTVESINGYVTIGYRIMSQDSPANYDTMLNSGSTALPYEPYGYKLPLTSGSTPVDIYLGDEPLRKIGDYADYIDYGTGKIVRQVAKKVFAGTETFTASSRYSGSFYIPWSSPSLGGKPSSPFLCTHGEYSNISQYSYGKITSDQACNLYLGQSEWTTADFKSYLSAQYTVGTPVTIWYPLATPVEEDPPVPFPQMPTSADSTTISWAGQGLAPSEFDSIQEWVDIPTYKRVNGEWVAE